MESNENNNLTKVVCTDCKYLDDDYCNILERLLREDEIKIRCECNAYVAKQ